MNEQKCSKCGGPLEKFRNQNKPKIWTCQKCQRLNQKSKMKFYQDKTILKIV